MRAGDWMRLMLVGSERNGGIYAESTCTASASSTCRCRATAKSRHPTRACRSPCRSTEASVVERLMPEGKRLIWIMTHHFPNGDGFGPVAAVTIGKTTAEVQSLGFLRLRPTRVDLSLWNIGPKAVLVGEGETCTDPKQAATCRRAANVLVYDHGRFHAPPIRRTHSGECIDAPWVEYKREADLTLENGWNRHMAINASVTHDERYVVDHRAGRSQRHRPRAPRHPAARRAQDRHRALHPRRRHALLHAPAAALAAHHPDRGQDAGAG